MKILPGRTCRILHIVYNSCIGKLSTNKVTKPNETETKMEETLGLSRGRGPLGTSDIRNTSL